MYTLTIKHPERDTELEISSLDDDEICVSVNSDDQDLAYYIDKDSAIVLIEFIKQEFKL